MKFEDVLTRARQGEKFTIQGMAGSYLTVQNGELIFVEKNKSSRILNIPSTLIMSDAWVEYDPIILVNMYPDRFKVQCPKCKKEYTVGDKWETRVGGVVNCQCGNRLLMKPPVEFESSTPGAPTSAPLWPKA
jgi:DNA-directed RNA polymerase subunit RPC12/RpoP